MNDAIHNRRLVARILLAGAVVFFLLAALSWTGILPIEPGARRLIVLSFGICAIADALIGFVLWSRSHSS